MKCDWKQLDCKGKWPTFKCANCNWTVTVQALPDDVQQLLASLPNCGVAMLQFREFAIGRRKFRALTATTPISIERRVHIALRHKNINYNKDTVDRRLKNCLVCNYFNKKCCTYFGTRCTRWEEWLFTLALSKNDCTVYRDS